MLRARNREINIFSMSALDLFAAALGAFILIAIALFPYFLNTGMGLAEPQREAEAENEAEEPSRSSLYEIITRQQAALKQAAKQKNKLTGEVKQLEERLKKAQGETSVNFQLPHLDLVVALDITGSMAYEIEGLKQEVEQLARVLGQLAPSVAVGVVAFGDRRYRQPFTQFDLVEIKHSRRNLEKLKSFIHRLTPQLGMVPSDRNPDGPEAFHGALLRAMDNPWRRRAEKKIIVMVTDNTAYPEETLATFDAADSFAGRGPGHGVSTVYTVTHEHMSAVEDFLTAVAKAGRGQAVQGGGSMTANLLLSLLN